MNFEDKYLKYKRKYLNLRGGMITRSRRNADQTNQIATNIASELNPFEEKPNKL
jgi:hypothetical protein